MSKNLIVGQSGGPTAVINGSLYGVVSEAAKSKDQIGKLYGMVNGIEGFPNDNYVNLEETLAGEELELLKTTPGAYLGSCRYKLPEDLNDPVYPELFKKFEALNIGYFFYIGGNDSMDTVSKLSRYAAATDSSIRVIGVPKTVDNDLVQTDHTPGFGSAAKYVAATVREVSMDAVVYDKPAVTIVEIMGRHAGWLTSASVLARKFKGDNPVLIYLPESAFCVDQFLDQVKAALEKTSTPVICISEGIHDADGTYICEYQNADGNAALDSFGHVMLAGAGKYLENLLKDRLGIKVRSIELNLPQRCSSTYLSATGLNEAVMAGAAGVCAALKGETGKMIAYVREDGPEYKISCTCVDVNEVCNLEKTVPAEWITGDGSDLSDELADYLLPYIQGDVAVPKVNGLPSFAYRK